MDLNLTIIILLFIGSFFANFVNVLSGGGGIIMIPLLLSLGLSPLQSLATNKAQSSISYISTIYLLHKKIAYDFSKLNIPVLFAILGGMTGTSTALIINNEWMNKIIPWLLLAIALYMMISKRSIHNPKNKKPLLTKIQLSLLIAFPMGFYDGFFGPSAGIILTTLLVVIQKLNIAEATRNTKLLNGVSNITATILYIVSGHIVWIFVVILMIGAYLGSIIGTRIISSSSIKSFIWIRYVTIIICIVSCIHIFIYGYSY